MNSSVAVEILDLRHFAAPSLRPLLDAESRWWRSRLSWDFQPSIRLLGQYLDGHMLPGFAAMESGRVAGYTFCVYEETKAVIGDVFALRPDREPDAQEIGNESACVVENLLLRHLCELLTNSPQVNRVESQLLLHPSGSHAEAFREAGFSLHRRLFLVQPLVELRSDPRFELPTHLHLRPWRDDDLNSAGRLISEAYRDHPDGVINDQYRTVHGSQRFLHNIVRYAGCGAFSPQTSFLIEERLTGEPVGLVLCSRVSPECGHVTQVCVHPRYRRQGLARILLAVTAYHHQRLSVGNISLTVTESNRAAVELYKAEGYERRHTFDAAVWERFRRA